MYIKCTFFCLWNFVCFQEPLQRRHKLRRRRSSGPGRGRVTWRRRCDPRRRSPAALSRCPTAHLKGFGVKELNKKCGSQIGPIWAGNMGDREGDRKKFLMRKKIKIDSLDRYCSLTLILTRSCPRCWWGSDCRRGTCSSWGSLCGPAAPGTLAPRRHDSSNLKYEQWSGWDRSAIPREDPPRRNCRRNHSDKSVFFMCHTDSSPHNKNVKKILAHNLLLHLSSIWLSSSSSLYFQWYLSFLTLLILVVLLNSIATISPWK